MKLNIFRGALTNKSGKRKTLVAGPVLSAAHQWFCFSRIIRKVTLTSIYLHYLKKYVLDQCIQQIFYWIVKAEALLHISADVVGEKVPGKAVSGTLYRQDSVLCDNRMDNFEARYTTCRRDRLHSAYDCAFQFGKHYRLWMPWYQKCAVWWL